MCRLISWAIMGIRRLVTGHDANGKAVFASDEQIEPISLALMPGAEFHRVWGADKPPRFPNDGSAQPANSASGRIFIYRRDRLNGCF